ncbi:hypothetical protein [Paraburkholderia sp.]|uniref:hypothetical protein n=1 Tax=Paraburkholderia sp. TaxID=1926495 RepID=UPI00238BFC2E|nr:hypothetical protein [Paraburkholderia sp.]MDE1181056.1 hypothetical protein [Paraburkholderia sp.]
MLSRSRRTVSENTALPERPAVDFSAAITAVKAASSYERAELIRDLVDAYRRLHGSVLRFVLMFEDGAQAASSADEPAFRPLQKLLSGLARHGEAAQFPRLRELKRAIKAARLAQQQRDFIFSGSFSNDSMAMRNTIEELERLDAMFVGLCVSYVMERHAPPLVAFVPVDARTIDLKVTT